MQILTTSAELRTSWEVGGATVFAAAALLLIASVAGKLAGVGLAGRLLGWGKGEASVICWLLQTKALIMIIFANVLLDKAIITSATFTALLLMAVTSTMLTIPWSAHACGSCPRWQMRTPPARPNGSRHHRRDTPDV